MAIDELLVKLVSKLDDKGFKELDKLEKKADKQTRILSASLRNMFVGVIGNIGVKEIVDASVKLDSLKTSFAALAGSDAGGAEQLKYLREETQRLGQDFVTAAEAYKNLFSAGRGAGMNPDEIQQIFSSVLEAGTVLGSSQQQMQGALMALEQMISKGKVSMEELRRQLGNALPGAMQIAALAMHTTSEGLQEMLEAGLDSKKFVTAFANQLHYEFGDKAVSASHTLRAELARLENAVFDLKTSFLDGDSGEAFADTIKQLVDVLKSPELQSSLQGISQGLTFLLKNIRLIGVVLTALGISKFIRFIVKATKGVTELCLQVLKLSKYLSRVVTKFGIMKGLLKILAKYGLALLVPFTDLALIVWTIVEGIIAMVKWIRQLNKKRKDTEQQPRWVKTSDGRFTDVNPKSKSFMQFGKEYTEKDIYDALRFGNKNEFVHKPDRFPKPSPIMYSAPQNNTTTVNITTNSDNPQGIGEAVKRAMFDVFESVRVRNGYPKTDEV